MDQPRRGSRRPEGDTGDLVLGWLTRLTLSLALAGVVAFDAISIATTYLAVDDQAAAAARAGSASYQQTQDVQAGYDVALATAVGADPGNEVPPSTFSTTPDGTVTLEVQRSAATVVVRHFSWLAAWADVAAQASGKELR